MNRAQRLWYAASLNEDRSEKRKDELSMVEYLASFWNSEAVKEIRERRESMEDGRFDSDSEFEQRIEDGELFDRDLIAAIKDKYKNTNLKANDDKSVRSGRGASLPGDISGLLSAIKDDI